MDYCGFPKSLIPSLCCPEHGLQLSLEQAEVEDGRVVYEGLLRCSAVSCTRGHVIRGGILYMLDRGQLSELQKSEIVSRDDQAPDYDRRLASRHEKEVPTTLAECGRIAGRKVIEYGCGTGRFTLHLLDADELLAVDFSLKSLQILSRKLSRHNSNVGLIWGDVARLRLAPNYFDLALSTQVLEHLATPQDRQRFLTQVESSLVVGGRLVCSAYHYDIRRWFKCLPQEGFHNSGIFYHYFTLSEIVQEVSSRFLVLAARPIDITCPLESRLRISPTWSGRFSRLLERCPPINRLGHLALVVAVKLPATSRTCVIYSWGLLFPWLLAKRWFWFTEPFDVPRTALLNFFSYQDINVSGFHRRPGLTSVIDLSQSIEAIRSKMRPNFILKQISKGERRGLVARRDKDAGSFRTLYRRFRLVHHLPVEKIKPLLSQSLIYSVYSGKRAIASGLFISNGVYMRAWALVSLTSREEPDRELVGQANRLLLWYAIQDSKASGHQLFDLGGISPASPHKHLRTLAEFKEAFGGERRQTFYYFKVYSRLLKTWMKIRGWVF